MARFAPPTLYHQFVDSRPLRETIPRFTRLMADRNYWIYILASGKNGTVYIGVTNSLERRTWQHKFKHRDGFSARYQVDRLVYFEAFSSIEIAIAREKQLKGGSRAKKLALINQANPAWQDMSDGWFD